PFTPGLLSNFLASISRSGISLVLPIFFHGALLYDALTAGILLIPFAVAFVTVGPLSGFLSDKYGARGFTTGGLLISAAALFGFAVVPGDASYSILASLMVVSGAGGGMFVAPNISSIMNATPVTRRGVASGMSATLVTTGALLSLAMVFVVLATSIPLDVLQAVFSGVTPGGSNASNIALFVNPMHTTFLIMGIMIGFVPTRLLATIDYLFVPPRGPGGYLLDTALILSIFLVYFVYAIRFISNRMERLNEYVIQMSPDAPVDGLRIPFRLANIL